MAGTLPTREPSTGDMISIKALVEALVHSPPSKLQKAFPSPHSFLNISNSAFPKDAFNLHPDWFMDRLLRGERLFTLFLWEAAFFLTVAALI
jgi:hypothetical protein